MIVWRLHGGNSRLCVDNPRFRDVQRVARMITEVNNIRNQLKCARACIFVVPACSCECRLRVMHEFDVNFTAKGG
jgi:hypothetical protein